MKKKLFRIILSGIIFIVAIVLNIEEKFLKLMFLLAYVISGYDIVFKAINNITRGQVFDENFLMSIATVGAFGIGEFPEAVAVMLFYQVGELFQSYAVKKSRKSISDLMDIRPDYANVKENNEIVKKDPYDVKIGDIIIIEPGEKIPLDGIIIEGKSMIDTSSLTGESVPRKFEVNDFALSGCINLDGVLIIKVIKEYSESTVSKILDLVENATSQKATSENFITKFARVYTPIVVFSALVIATLPVLLINGVFSEWVYRALTFLVVSCPCALVISVPLSFFGGIGGASQKGILVKGSNYLEALAQTEIVVCDKTGTLTKGVFEVQKVCVEENLTEEELIKFSAYVESFSNHPIANSIKKYYGKEIDKSKVSEVKEISGYGIEAFVEGKYVAVGNKKLMLKNGIESAFWEKDIKELGTVVYVAIDNKYAGYIVISDEIKSDTKEFIKELKKRGINKTVMLTGDLENVAEKVANEIGIDEVYAELLPENKVEKVENLLKQKSKNGKLVFIGDGINDAPVLARADIGVAMGGLGSDAAIEAADIVIMNDEPLKIVTAIKISQKTLNIVKQNIWFAILIKVGVLVLSALGLANMWQAVFADVGVAVIAILNAMRALNTKNI